MVSVILSNDDELVHCARIALDEEPVVVIDTQEVIGEPSRKRLKSDYRKKEHQEKQDCQKEKGSENGELSRKQCKKWHAGQHYDLEGRVAEMTEDREEHLKQRRDKRRESRREKEVNETKEEREERLKIRRDKEHERCRKKEVNETKEEREERLKIQRDKERERRTKKEMNETKEEREERLNIQRDKERERRRKKEMNKTKEERQERLKIQRDKERVRRKQKEVNETNEEREAREERLEEQRRQQDQEVFEMNKEMEKQLKKQQDQRCKKKKQLEETQEEREERLNKQRDQQRERRRKKRQCEPSHINEQHLRLRTEKQDEYEENNDGCDDTNIVVDVEMEQRPRHDMVENGFSTVITRFFKSVSEGPIYVCTSCWKMDYRKNVVVFNVAKLRQAKSVEFTSCKLSADGREYICKRCWNNVKRDVMPAQCHKNRLELPPIPPELECLNDLEVRLLCTRYPFMKILCLPVGGQAGIHGSVINVPVDASKVCSSLPRSVDESGLIAVRLKRAMNSKSAWSYKYVRPSVVQAAYDYLTANNAIYREISFNHEWQQTANDADADLWKHLQEPMEEEESAIIARDVLEELLEFAFEMSEQDLDHIPYCEFSSASEQDMCVLQEHINPSLDGVCVATDSSDSDDEVGGIKIHEIAPGEGQKPVSVLLDVNAEVKSFPKIFPTGEFGFDAERIKKLSIRDYFECRLKSCDPRFATTDYLFWAQNVLEYSRLLDSISIALRKGKNSTTGNQKITADFVRNSESLNELMRTDLGYRFMASVRGSGAYWQKTRCEVLGMVRQLGVPTFFMTVSAADMRWPDMINAIAQQFGRSFTDAEIQKMSFSERSHWIKANPVTAARHFNHRLHALFREVILAKEEPLGPVTDYFWRVEAQARGSLHAHCLLWLKGAPKIGENSDEEVVEFIDKYCTVRLPKEDDDFRELVMRQRHIHTKTCYKKKKSECRFKFPRKPMKKTVIIRNVKNKVADAWGAIYDQIFVELGELARDFYERRREEGLEVPDLPFMHTSAASQSDTTKESCDSGKITIELKRTKEEVFINPYNETLLRAWGANVDLQFVTNAHAVIRYILDYMCKPERELGETMKAAMKDLPDKCLPRERLKKLGNVFINSRMLSAQEAAVRAIGLPMRQLSRSVVFVNSDLPQNRTHILKSKAELDQLDKDSEDVFRDGLIEKYAAV